MLFLLKLQITKEYKIFGVSKGNMDYNFRNPVPQNHRVKILGGREFMHHMTDEAQG